jgi:hypothetical protein
MSEQQTRTPVSDLFISETAVLKCVLAALESRSEESEGPDRKLASAELALRNCIAQLEGKILDDIGNMEIIRDMALDHMEAEVRKGIARNGRKSQEVAHAHS